MTASAFRKLALSFPEAVESSHMHHPDFRVGGRVFATLGYPNEDCSVVKLSIDLQKQFVRAYPDVFRPVKGGWGRRGNTNLHLPSAKVNEGRAAIAEAWSGVAPMRLQRS